MEAKSETFNRLQLAQVNLSSGTSSGEEVPCPNCNAKLKPYEVAQHCEQEIQCLRQLQSGSAINTNEETEHNSEERRKPWTVFQRIQRNRQSRLKRIRKRQTPVIEHPCPICNESFSQEEIQAHTEHCLRRSNPNDENSSNEEDETEQYEEYEWAGQKRIRVSSLLQGGYASIGIGQTINLNGRQEDDEEEDLNVDEDDTQIYGPAQYGENDVILAEQAQNCEGEESDVTNYMRRLITEGTQVANTNAVPGDGEQRASRQGAPSSSNEEDETAQKTALATTTSTIPYKQIIESLKTKLRQYEKNIQSKFKCLICLDEYRNPAISVSCWHVHCEECWLRSLGARKLCPQCNLITTPKDLRRIYM